MSFKKKLAFLKSQSIKKAKIMDPKVSEKKHYNTIDRASPCKIYFNFQNINI